MDGGGMMGGKKWSIPTEYKGIQMRSKLEAKWAKWFDDNGIRWIYEPEGFQKDGIKYLPDFALPDLKIIFEVKGVMDDYDQKKKKIMVEICKETGWLYVIGFDDIPYAFLYSLGEKMHEDKINILQEKEIQKNFPEIVIFNIIYDSGGILRDTAEDKLRKHINQFNEKLRNAAYMISAGKDFKSARYACDEFSSFMNNMMFDTRWFHESDYNRAVKMLENGWKSDNDEYYKQSFFNDSREKNEKEDVLQVEDELIGLYISCKQARETIKKVVDEFNSVILDHYLLFFKEVGEKYDAEESFERLKDYFSDSKIRLVGYITEKYRGLEDYTYIINDAIKHFKIRELRYRSHELDIHIEHNTAMTDEEKISMIKERLEIQKEINKLRILE
jgi:hypothetical protein